MFNSSSLFVSLLWSSVGAGYFVYGKRQQSPSAMAGGGAMILLTYFADSGLLLSLGCLAIMAAVYFLARKGV